MKYKGYCVADIDGLRETMPPVNLNNEQEIWNYINVQKIFFDEIFFEDDDGYVVLHIKDRVIVFPEELSGRSIMN